MALLVGFSGFYHFGSDRRRTTLKAEQRERQVPDIIGYCLSSVIALGIMFIGARFAFAPHAAAEAYGVSVGRDPHWEAYLSVKAVRDIACGLFTGILILNRSAHLLGWFMGVAGPGSTRANDPSPAHSEHIARTIIPLADAAIVLRHGGTKAAAFGIHGATAGIMLIVSGLLLASSRLKIAIDWARTPPAGSGRCN